MSSIIDFIPSCLREIKFLEDSMLNCFLQIKKDIKIFLKIQYFFVLT